MSVRREAQALRSWLDAAPIPLFGISSATLLLGGVLLGVTLPSLPTTAWCLALVAIGLMLIFAGRFGRLIGMVLLGLGWVALHGQWAMQQRLPFDLQGVDVQVLGQVEGLPQREERSVRFDFRVEADDPDDALRGRRLRLSWYGAAPKLAPGSRWQLQLRLKRPRGVINPGGFDFERYALERRLAATGYVRDNPDNRELSGGRGTDALRQRLSEAIARAVPSNHARFVQALAIGDTRHLTERDWEVLRASGIAHLIAISGFHVGLVAGFGALLIRLLYRLRPRLGLRWPLPQAAAFVAVVFAAGYSALAGFELPTVRTLLMIAAALLAVWLRRRLHPWHALALALIAVLLFDPLSVLGAGFWLSFLGVAWLLWCLPQDRVEPLWRTLLSAQGVMSLGLLPLTVWFFGQASLLGPFANLVAVPWVSLVVVPLALIGTALTMLSPVLGAPFLLASGSCMQWLWWGLEAAVQWRGAQVYLPTPDMPAFALALIGAFWLLLPRAVPGKGLAAFLFLPLLWPRSEPIAPGEAELWLLDVGQGLSVLVRTADHAVLYDAGPAYAGGLDLGDSAVVPALRALGVPRIDAYIESHGDNDHAGGSAAVRRAYAPPTVFATNPEHASAQACRHGESWKWDGVEFSFLHPPEHFPYLRNDSSCVLRIEAEGAVALLPGDISEIIERRLLREQPAELLADVLVVPHHGSRSSSSPNFIAALAPRLALIGAGHRNRFDLPRPEVVQRYVDAGVAVENSASTGAIRVQLGREGVGRVERWRERAPRFWRERG